MWILQHILVEIVLLAMLMVLIMDLGNTARIQLEDKMGSRNFTMVVTGLIAASVLRVLLHHCSQPPHHEAGGTGGADEQAVRIEKA